jgi:hypothetical protein
MELKNARWLALAIMYSWVRSNRTVSLHSVVLKLPAKDHAG